MNTEKNFVVTADSALEELLGNASPRPVPPSDDEKAIRDAVHAEWRAITRKRKVRRHLVSYATAATLLLAIAVSYNGLSSRGEPAAQVATIAKSVGSIYVLGEQSELRELIDTQVISAGQTIVTGDGAGMGLAWANNGQLRVDQNTRIEFLSPNSIYLRSGRVYFDSEPSELLSGIESGPIDSVPDLNVHTDHGVVTHLGTQYMTSFDNDILSVSVREGQIAVSETLYPSKAIKGQQLTIAGNARPMITNVAVYGPAWQWVEATAPAANVDGRTVHEFLLWVGDETGMELYFDSSAAEQLAKEARLVGTVDTAPTKALDFWMSGVDLEWSIDEGFIHVRNADSGAN